jgi:hypothetical protein
VDLLVAALTIALAVWFLYCIARSFLPGRFTPTPLRRVSQKCPVCRDVLNPAAITALRQGRRRCPEMARCPYRRSRWLN